MKNKVTVVIVLVIVLAGFVYYLNIDSKEVYLEGIQKYDLNNPIRYRIEPMPNVFVPKKFRFRTWSNLH